MNGDPLVKGNFFSVNYPALADGVVHQDYLIFAINLLPESKNHEVRRGLVDIACAGCDRAGSGSRSGDPGEVAHFHSHSLDRLPTATSM